MSKQNHKLTDDEIICEFNKNPHIGKIATTLNVPHITIWRRLKKLNLTPNSKTGVAISLDEILDGKHPYYQTFKLKNRLIKNGIMKNECTICGIKEWNGKSINMQLDHIDGVSSNHFRSNLRMICPNCHSQTDTYCGKNKVG